MQNATNFLKISLYKTMKRNSLEIADAKAQLIKRNLDILNAAKTEVRELTDEENEEFKENEEEIQKLDEEMKELEDELENKENKDGEETDPDEKDKNTENRKMEKTKFNLMQELRNAMETGKSIKLEQRAYTIQSEGEDLVETDVYNILEPLRAKNVLVNAGAHFYTGLVGDVQIPVMSGGQVFWAAETGAASDGSGSFTSVSLAPKRLTAKFPISLQFLAQDSVDAEGAIRRDIINALNDKLEATILGNAAGTTTQPAGMFYNQTPDEIASFADITALEADIEAANVYGDCKYVMAPSAKAALRGMIKGTNATGMVFENNAVDGTDALVTSNVATDKLIYGDFSNLVIGQWGDIQIDVVRDTASLANGCVTIVLNSFWDAQIARAEAFGYGVIDRD